MPARPPHCAKPPHNVDFLLYNRTLFRERRLEPGDSLASVFIEESGQRSSTTGPLTVNRILFPVEIKPSPKRSRNRTLLP